MLQKIPFPDNLHQRQRLFWVYVLLITVISLFPSDSSTLPIKHIDKVGHFLAYVVMSVLAAVSFERGKKQTTAVFLTLIIAVLLEWGQGFVPGRLSNLADGITNILGLLAGLLIPWVYRSRSKPK